MKKIQFAALYLCLVTISCGKSDSPAPTAPTATSYMNVKVGSSWNFEQINNKPPVSTSNYTLTSINKDSIVNGNSYHVYTNSSTSTSEYFRIAGDDYYTYQSLPAALGSTKVENLYLKSSATVGTSWSQVYNITYSSVPLAVTVTHTIQEKGISKTVNGIVYNNVIHIKTGIAVGGIPPASLVTDIHYYYAPNYGLIENSSKIDLNYLTIISSTDITTRLKTAALL